MTSRSNTARQQHNLPLATATERPRRQKLLAAAIAATLIFWSTAFVGISIAIAEIPPTELALFRFLIAALTLAIVMLLRRDRKPQFPSRKHWPGFLLMGMTVAGYQLLLNFGQQTVASGIASLLIATIPVITAVLAVATLRERLGVRGWLGLALAFAGSVFLAVSRNHDLSINTGALFILGAAVAGALYTVVQKKYSAAYDSVSLAAFSIGIAALLLLPAFPSMLVSITQASAKAILAAIYLGIFSSAIGYATWAYALSRLPASRVSSLLYVIPPLVFVEAWLMLGTTPDLASIVSGVVIIGGVILINRRRSRKGVSQNDSD